MDVDGNSWRMQCKCWAPHRPIKPEMVRELAGAIECAEGGSIRSSRGMIITTTNLTTSDANEVIALGFRLTDGALFAKLVHGA